jgi:hypothetical protein
MRKKVLDNQNFGFLFKGFESKPIPILWECSAIMLRKISMIAIVVFFSNDGVQIQIMCLLFMLVIALVLHTRYQPFEIDELDSLEMWSLLSSYFTLFFGMFFTDGIRNNVSEQMLDFFTVIIVLMNVCTLIKFFHCLYIAAKVMSDAFGVTKKLKGGAVAAAGATKGMVQKQASKAGAAITPQPQEDLEQPGGALAAAPSPLPEATPYGAQHN